MKNYLENLIEENLHDLIDDGKIKVLSDNQKYFDKLEKNYPIGLNRIVWDDVVNRLEREVSDEKDIDIFLDEVIAYYPKIVDENVIVFGDNIDRAYIMPFTLFKDEQDEFFSIPQHAYVVNDPHITWCINYTFEGSIFFALAP